MKQSFSLCEYERFKKFFKIKTSPGEWDSIYLHKTQKYVLFIRWIPGIKMVGVGNSIAMNSGNKNSDIDLFIVCENGHIWFVRILVTCIFQIFGVRKTAKKHAGRFCLSFFATISWMDFSSFSLKNDIYLYFWVLYFRPILDYNNTYIKFIEQNTSWADFSLYSDIIEDNKNNIFLSKTIVSSPFVMNFTQKINIFLKKCFLWKTLRHYEKLGKPFGVIISDTMLKFHDKDIRNNLTPTLSLEGEGV